MRAFTVGIGAALLVLVVSEVHAQGTGAVGSQFQVNSYTTGDQSSASVAASVDQGFVVVWDSFGSPGDDTQFDSIQGQRFDSSGTPVGGPFQINTYTTNSQWGPDVDMTSTGGFVVAWTSRGSAGGGTPQDSIKDQSDGGHRQLRRGVVGSGLDGRR